MTSFLDTSKTKLTFKVDVGPYNQKIILVKEQLVVNCRHVNGVYIISESAGHVIRFKVPDTTKIVITGEQAFTSSYTRDILFADGVNTTSEIMLPNDFTRSVRNGKIAANAIEQELPQPLMVFLGLMSLDKKFEPVLKIFLDEYKSMCKIPEDLTAEGAGQIDDAVLDVSQQEVSFYILVFVLSLAKGPMSLVNYTSWLSKRKAAFMAISGTDVKKFPKHETITLFKKQADFFPNLRHLILNGLMVVQFPFISHIMTLLQYNLMTGMLIMTAFIDSPSKTASHIDTGVLKEVELFINEVETIEKQYGELFKYFRFFEPVTQKLSQKTYPHLYAASLVHARIKDSRYRNYASDFKDEFIANYERLSRIRLKSLRPAASFVTYSTALRRMGFDEETYQSALSKSGDDI
nr:MAG: ORF1 protein [Xinmoviridae sp. 1]